MTIKSLCRLATQSNISKMVSFESSVRITFLNSPYQSIILVWLDVGSQSQCMATYVCQGSRVENNVKSQCRYFSFLTKLGFSVLSGGFQYFSGLEKYSDLEIIDKSTDQTNIFQNQLCRFQNKVKQIIINQRNEFAIEVLIA